MVTELDAGRAAQFARVALANVRREYPHKLDHLLHAPPQALVPRQLHPAFYGSYDWHSAVHMHWLLARCLRLHPVLREAGAMTDLLDTHLAEAPLAIEQAYFEGPGQRTFERPYGWAWLLELQAELLRLARGRTEARRWERALAPLAGYLAGRMRELLALAPYPLRSGTHASTPFACILALDYARVSGDAPLAAAIETAARRWHLHDRDAPIDYEPSLADFLSPTLVEAHLVCEVLPAQEFADWLAAFLPAGLRSLAAPPKAPDRSDAQMVHLDGLSLSRAWSLRRLAAAMPADGETDFKRACEAAAARHLEAGLPQASGGDYVGEHWLASFAALALGETP